VLYEQLLLWHVRAQRLIGNHDQSLKVLALDYIIRREIGKKILQEQAMDNEEG
jgi:hypothetical protein